MNSTGSPQWIAIAGGSGTGKTWLADELQALIGETAGRLSLDDFYLDRSRVPMNRRAGINYDHPRAIDWPYFEHVLRNCRLGRFMRLPCYDFAQHTRSFRDEPWAPRPVMLVDGLWLLERPSIRKLFDLRVFIDCPASLRLQRRIERDVQERGRTRAAARRQFLTTVAPMHKRFVAPQMRWADLVLKEPLAESDLDHLASTLWGLLSSLFPAWMRATFRAELLSRLKPSVRKRVYE